MRKCKAIIHDVCPSSRANNFYKKNAYCCISLTNPNYYGKRLDAVVKFLVSNFQSFLIVTSGYIYRKHYELFNDENNQLAFEEAINVENKHINEELIPTISQYNDYKIKFIRWSELCNKPYYKMAHKGIINLFNENLIFRQHINDTAKNFIEKKMNSDIKIKIKVSKDIGIKLSIDFLLEEIAMFDFLVEKGYPVEVYPGIHIPVLKNIILGEIQDAPINLKNRTSIELKIHKIGNKVL